MRQIVAEHTVGRQFGFLGEPAVNVLELNLDLDGQKPMPSTRGQRDCSNAMRIMKISDDSHSYTGNDAVFSV